jgi:general stress protein 26
MKKHIKSSWKKFELYCLTSLLLLMAAPPDCKAQEKPATLADRDSIIAAAREIIGMQKYCALINVDSSGKPQVRTMNPFPPEDDMTVWIATNSRSRKVKEIRNNPQVCLYYADHTKAAGYVSISGKAVLVDDMNEKLKRKREYWNQAFPDWNYLMLIQVIPERLEVINYKRGMLNDSVTWSAPSVEFTKP